MSLNKTKNKRYELLVVDAFSGDSVPVHLLTTQAISEYKKCITEDGIILFHISNRYLRLAQVLFSNADALNASACISSNETTKPELRASIWVALTWNEDIFDKLTSQLKWDREYFHKRRVKSFRPWTDLYSNIPSVFKIDQFLDSVKEFQPFYW